MIEVSTHPQVRHRAYGLARACFIVCAAVLTGCGGGGASGGGGEGGGGGGAVVAIDPFDTAEFRRSYGLARINVLPAYNAGHTGAGQTVAIIDTGIDVNHVDLDANISANSIDIVVNNFNTVNDADGHGTMVAGVVAAEKNNFGMHGVAYEATLLAIRADGLGNCWPEKTCPFFDPDLVLALDYAIAQGAGIINMSLGGPGASSKDFTDALLRAVNAGIIITIARWEFGDFKPPVPGVIRQGPGLQRPSDRRWRDKQFQCHYRFQRAGGHRPEQLLGGPGREHFHNPKQWRVHHRRRDIVFGTLRRRGCLPA